MKIDYPTEINLLATNRCNSRCTSCNIWKQKPVKNLKCSVYGNLPSSLKKITLSGGEASLREDLIDVVKILNKRCNKPRFILPTNGLLPFLIEKRLIEILQITKKIGVRVSIDGIGDMQDKTRGIKGSFNSALKTIEVCKKLGIKDLGISFTMQDKNLDEIKKVYILSRKLNIEFSCCAADNSFRYGKFDNKLSGISELDRALNFLIKNELKRTNPKSLLKAFYFYGLLHHLKGRIKGRRRMILDCAALEKFFLLDPAGNIFPCTLLDNNIGNIKKEGFDRLWLSQKAQDARNTAKKCPVACWTGCNVNTAIRRNKFKVASWILLNKIKAHLGATKFA